MTESRKTVFILVGRGFIAKSILRSGVLEHLKKSGARIVIFFFDVHGKGIPQYLKDEFEDEQVTLESVIYPQTGRLYRRFKILIGLFVYNKTNRKFRYLVAGRSSLRRYLEMMFLFPISRIRFLKRVARWIEKVIFKNTVYGKYFDVYKPDVVFSTSIISAVDIEFMKEAQKRSIKTVSMPRGWDNINTLMYKFVPDRIIVQNESMKKGAVDVQVIPPERVYTTGFPQFDWYRRPGVIVSREEYLATLGLDPNRKLILWGSTGSLTQINTAVCELLAKAVNSKDILAQQSSLLIRAHYSDVRQGRFKHLHGVPNVKVDDSITLSDFFWDNVDPSEREIIGLTNTLHHADLVIIQSSTMSLDALCLDTPVINTAFKGFYDKKGRDVTEVLYEEDCYRPLIEGGAVDLVFSEEELMDMINKNLLHPHKNKEARARIIAELAYKVDGKASKRIADVVLACT